MVKWDLRDIIKAIKEQVPGLFVGAILTLFGVGITLWIQGMDEWANIDLELAILVQTIVAADASETLDPPAYGSDREILIKFVRDVQKRLHNEIWTKLNQQIPAVKNDSSLRDWKLALSGHSKIERVIHPQYAALNLEAIWNVVSSNEKIGTPVSMPLSILEYALGDINLKQAQKALAGATKVDGVMIQREKKVNTVAVYPSVDTSIQGIREKLSTETSAAVYPDKSVFVPSFQTLRKLNDAGIKIDDLDAISEKDIHQ